METIDDRFITNEFLLKYFPSPNRFREQTNKTSTSATSRQRYLTYKNNINKKRARSGLCKIDDPTLALIITKSDGYLQTPRILKPNQ